MSHETERIPVPDPVATDPAPASDADSGAVSRDQTVAFTPNQLAAGFGIVAGLLLLFFGARRRRRRAGDDE